VSQDAVLWDDLKLLQNRVDPILDVTDIGFDLIEAMVRVFHVT
jgi:hypothetical protein